MNALTGRPLTRVFAGTSLESDRFQTNSQQSKLSEACWPAPRSNLRFFSPSRTKSVFFSAWGCLFPKPSNIKEIPKQLWKQRSKMHPEPAIERPQSIIGGNAGTPNIAFRSNAPTEVEISWYSNTRSTSSHT